MDKYKEKKRERRLRDRERMIARGRRYWLQRYYGFTYDTKNKPRFRLHEAEMHGRIYHDNLTICSCDLCCNPRHSSFNKPKDRLTIQERKALEIEKKYEKIDN